jgi:hypothetical protein
MTKFSEYLQDKSDSRNFERLQKEVERLREIDKRKSEYVYKLWSEEQKCSLPGCCNK